MASPTRGRETTVVAWPTEEVLMPIAYLTHCARLCFQSVRLMQINFGA